MANFTGGPDNDQFLGTPAVDTASGNGGNDVLAGAEAADTLAGGEGDDSLFSAFEEHGWNQVTAPNLDGGTEVDTLNGGTGSDTLLGGYGDHLDGGLGAPGEINTLLVSFRGAASGVTANFATLAGGGTLVIGGGTIANIQRVPWVFGSDYADVLTAENSSYANIRGYAGDDQLTVGSGGGVFDGGSGVDTIVATGVAAANYLYGGSGNDTILGGSGSESHGDAGNDSITGGGLAYGGSDDDTIAWVSTAYGEGGADTISNGEYAYGGDDNDVITGSRYSFGGNQNDTITVGAQPGAIADGGNGNDTLNGGGNDDRLYGGAGIDVLNGMGGADILYSEVGPDAGGLDRNSFHDVLNGGEGDDQLHIGFGDGFNGGAGFDTLYISLRGPDVKISTVALMEEAATTQIEAIAEIIGWSADDAILVGQHGFDVQVWAGEGNDRLIARGSSAKMHGEAGNDLFTAYGLGALLDGGDGIDTADYGAAGGAVILRLDLGIGSDSLSGIEIVLGSAYGDEIVGDGTANQFSGAGGNDVLRGLADADVLDGGAGADQMFGGIGDDVFVVDQAGDQVVELAGEGTDTVRTTLTSYTLGAELENLTYTGAGAFTGTGNGLDNLIKGGTGADTLKGLDGNDRIEGGGAADISEGGEGNDTLVGGAQLYGQAGDDNLRGTNMAGGIGDDYYTVDGNATVVEAAGEGFDTVFTNSSSYTLSLNVEKLIARYWGTGNALDNDITGSAFTNNVLDGGAGADIMRGLAGDDQYYVDNAGDQVVEAANEGFDIIFASVNYTLAGIQVERLVLTGNAALTGHGNGLANELWGNDAANILRGFGGADVLDGKGGADTMEGGERDDVYYVENAGDRAVELAGEGYDTVYASVSFTLGDNVEALRYWGSSAPTPVTLTGNTLDNLLVGVSGVRLEGGAGNDRFEGNATSMTGDTGNDYYVLSGGTTVTERQGEGVDTVEAWFSYTLPQWVERLILTATAANGTGNEIDNEIIGNDAANTLNGNDGNDMLSGAAGNDTLGGGTGNDRLDGGLGADAMTGGTGDDLFIVDNVGDTVQENAGEGYDTIESRVNVNLTTIAAVEAVVLTGTAVIDATGNGLDNALTGNAAANGLVGNDGNDVLDGKGGADTMVGGIGDDWYYVDDVSDKVVEYTGQGIDTVQSVRNFSLQGTAAENLILAGTYAIDAIGNDLANRLTGNDAANGLVGYGGNDLLDGRGGNDTLVGGLGDDWYVVEGSNDTIVEKANEGVDTVESVRNVNLTTMAAVENVVLAGPHAIDAVGNALANALTGNDAANGIVGNAGDDVLSGRGGNDTLIGGAGLDWFVFDTALGAGNIDWITDFAVADDTIQLDRSIFAGIAADGTLAAGAFRLGTAAVDADDRILYDAATGNLWYDADGVGGAAAVQFATLKPGLALTNADFFAVP